jgi:hypothetical protein
VVTVLGVGVMWMDRRPHQECGGSRGKTFKKTILFGNILGLIVCNTSEHCYVTLNVYNKAVTCNTNPQFGG